MSELDIDHLREWIGREDIVSEHLTAAQVARFNATFDAPGEVREDDPAPGLIHWCLAPLTAPTVALGSDGHPMRGGFLPPVPLPRRMWASGEMAFHGDIRVGETVTRRSTIRDVTVKHGRSGTLCFVTVDHRIESGGRLAVEERQDIVYRGADTPSGTGRAPEPAPEGDSRAVVTPDPAFLFRYSALTFNGHRIHYDVPYAREVEGYPGLVVHGPLQATLLARFAETVRGTRPQRFRFRSVSPLFDTADFAVNACDDAGALRLWTSTVGGPVAMEARAEW